MTRLSGAGECGILIGAEGTYRDDRFKREIASLWLPSGALSKCLNREPKTGDFSFTTKAGRVGVRAPGATLAMRGTNPNMDKSIISSNRDSRNLSQMPLDLTIEVINEDGLRGVILDGKKLISILDAYKIYGKSSNPTRDWKRDKVELAQQGYNLPDLVTYAFTGKDGKRKQPVPVVNEEQMARIAQVAKFPEWEWMRQRMVELFVADQKRPDKQIKQQQDIVALQLKGHPVGQAAARVESKDTQSILTAVAKRTHVTESPNYNAIPSVQNSQLFGKTKAALIEYLGLLPKDEGHWRDFLGQCALEALNAVNRAAAARIASRKQKLTDEEQCEIVSQVISLLGPGFKNLAAAWKQDFISGADLDEDGRPIINRNQRLLGRGKQ